MQKQPLFLCSAQTWGWNRKLGERMLTRQVGTEQMFSKQKRESLLIECSWRRVQHQANYCFICLGFVLFRLLKRKFLSNEIKFSWHSFFWCWWRKGRLTYSNHSKEKYWRVPAGEGVRFPLVSYCSVTQQAVIVHNARVGEVSPFFSGPKRCQQTISNCDKSKLCFLCQS